MRTLCVFALVAAASMACGKGGSDNKKTGLPPADEITALPKPVVAQIAGSRAPAKSPPTPTPTGAGAANPHAGVDMGGAAAASKQVRGKIVASKETEGLIKAGDTLFISIKARDPATGKLAVGSLAVDRLAVSALPMEFTLSVTAASVGSDDAFSIVARVDGDGEARTRSAGDVEGSVETKIPAEGLTLTLDTVVKDDSSR